MEAISFLMRHLEQKRAIKVVENKEGNIVSTDIIAHVSVRSVLKKAIAPFILISNAALITSGGNSN